MNKGFYAFKRSHNLVNRIYDMLIFFGTIKRQSDERTIKNFFNQRLEDVEYVETLANFFERKARKYKNNPDVRCNLTDLIYDLDYLKQYLS